MSLPKELDFIEPAADLARELIRGDHWLEPDFAEKLLAFANEIAARTLEWAIDKVGVPFDGHYKKMRALIASLRPSKESGNG